MYTVMYTCSESVSQYINALFQTIKASTQHFFRFEDFPKGRVHKKNRKKLTNVSLVCMYVGRKSEMSLFLFFFPNRSNLSTISMVA